MLFPETYARATSTQRKGAPPRIRRAHIWSHIFITQSREAAKKKRRKLSFSFPSCLCASAPLREPHRHLPRSRHPGATGVQSTTWFRVLVSGSIYQPKTSVCVARWMLKQVQHDAWEEYRSAISAPLREPFFRRSSAGWGLSRLSVERGAIRRDAIGSSLRWSDGVFGGIWFCLSTLRSVWHDGC